MVLRLAAATLLASLLAWAPAAASTGGAAPPEASGGVSAGQPLRRSPPRITGLSATVTPPPGAGVSISFRVRASTRAVRLTARLTRRGAPPLLRVRLGAATGNRRRSRTLDAASVPPGRYTLVLVATDAAGRTGRASTAVTLLPEPEPAEPAAPVAAPAAASGVFPVQGAWTFGGDASRFGAPRSSHAHQGQDIAAAEGTSVVAPEPGVVTFVAFQPAGAGHYVILRTAPGREMAFMHLQDGSIPVAAGTPVTAGQLLGRVGSTGTASGPHLHFEIWPAGWRTTPGAHPADPLPDLIAWAATR